MAYIVSTRASLQVLINAIYDRRTVEEYAEALTGEAEEQRYVVVGAHVAAGMQRQDVVFRHEVVHHSEDTLLHLPGVLAAQDDHFSGLRNPQQHAPSTACLT